MKDTAPLPFEQLFLELTFAVTGEPNEEAILARTIPIYLRRLNCVLAAAVRATEDGCDVRHLLPRAFQRDERWEYLLKKLCEMPKDQPNAHFASVIGGLHMYAYPMSGYGWLILGRSTVFSRFLENELKDVVAHLGKALNLADEIAKRQESERQLRSATDTLSSVVNALPDLILRINNKLVFTYCHTNHPENLLMPASAFIGKSAYALLPDALADKIKAGFDRVIDRPGETDLIEYELPMMNQSKWFEARVVGVNAEEALFVIRDITHRKRSEFELARKERMLLAVAKSTNALLSEVDVYAAMHTSLSLLGEAAGVDRTYYFEGFRREGELRVSQKLEWCAQGIESELENPELKDCPAFIDFDDPVNKADPFNWIVNELESMPELREILQMQGIQSILILPVLVDGEFWGFVGFDDCSTERHWTDAELSLLQSFASSVGSAFARKQYAEHLRISKEEAEKASAAKSQFLANMSHEIRTPLNSIVGFTELLSKSQLNSQQREYLQAIANSSRVLRSNVDDILDISKIEAGKIELENARFNLDELTTELSALFAQSAKTKRIEFTIECHAEVARIVEGDLTRIRQVLVNLLANAIKFTEAGAVKLHILPLDSGEDRQRIEFSVVDTGIGIHPEKQATILEPFAQEDLSTTRKFGGSGLGLAITCGLLELMGSHLVLESEPGKGSRFSFTLSLKPLTQEGANNSFNGSYGLEENAPLSMKSFSIAVIDDAPMNQMLVRNVIEILLPAARIQLVNGGKSFVENLPPTAPDLILMDIQMPEMSGYEATDLLRKNTDYQKVPIIALTAGAVKGERERCLASGMDDYLSKPMSFSELRSKLKSHLGA